MPTQVLILANIDGGQLAAHPTNSTHPLPRIPEHPQPFAVFPPIGRIPGILHGAEHALGCGIMMLSRYIFEAENRTCPIIELSIICDKYTAE